MHILQILYHVQWTEQLGVYNKPTNENQTRIKIIKLVVKYYICSLIFNTLLDLLQIRCLYYKDINNKQVKHNKTKINV